ncbi:hypothetical protein [Candidatus Sodalis pierantonius]|uniref:hypothetical protein n=1 Tax=Candidatus Sodalis pierantonii TaxID=1486991 RepID=UPI001F3F4D9A|nr:hypothetical protein [Candidatus Sodalis pierantonius]
MQQLVKRSAGGVNNRTVQQRFTAAAAFGGIIDPVVRQAIGGQAGCTNRVHNVASDERNRRAGNFATGGIRAFSGSVFKVW